MQDLPEKKHWETPKVQVYGDMVALTQGDTYPIGKNVGFGDDILSIVIPNGSSFPANP